MTITHQTDDRSYIDISDRKSGVTSQYKLKFKATFLLDGATTPIEGEFS